MNKNRKKRIWLYALVIVFLLLAVVFAYFICQRNTKKDKKDSTIVTQESDSNKDKEKKTESKHDIDYKALGIKAYNYPSEFTMGDDLKRAIANLAITYDNFDQNVVKKEDWKKDFISYFIQNSRYSFDYLDQIAEKNNGKIGINELNYMQYSLTNIKVDLSSSVTNFVDSNDDSSGMNYGVLTDYNYEVTDEGVNITANLEVSWDGTDYTQKSEVTAKLIKNEYSCFDGYSILSLSTKTIESKIEQDNKEHICYASGIMEEDNGVFTFDCVYSDDNLYFTHFVDVDLSKLPELADLVRNNPRSDFKVTYFLRGDEKDLIEKVIPTDITLDDKKNIVK